MVDSILLSITGASNSAPPWISLHRGSIEVKTVKKVLPRKKTSQTSAETRKKKKLHVAIHEKYLLLTEFSVRTVNYGLTFLGASRLGHKSKGNNDDSHFTVRTEKTKLVRYLLYPYQLCVSDGFGNDFYSRVHACVLAERYNKRNKLCLLVLFSTLIYQLLSSASFRSTI